MCKQANSEFKMQQTSLVIALRFLPLEISSVSLWHRCSYFAFLGVIQVSFLCPSPPDRKDDIISRIRNVDTQKLYKTHKRCATRNLKLFFSYRELRNLVIISRLNDVDLALVQIFHTFLFKSLTNLSPHYFSNCRYV